MKHYNLCLDLYKELEQVKHRIVSLLKVGNVKHHEELFYSLAGFCSNNYLG